MASAPSTAAGTQPTAPAVAGEFDFGPDVVEPVRLHVAAKRYLCAAEPGYFALLSPASVYTLSLQGGPMAPAEAAVFAAGRYAANAVAVRRWDDAAKDPAALRNRARLPASFTWTRFTLAILGFSLCVLGLENKVQVILLIGALPLLALPFGNAASASVAFWRHAGSASAAIGCSCTAP